MGRAFTRPGRTIMGLRKFETISEVVQEFPKSLLDCRDVIIAGGAAVDPLTATDVDVFFVGHMAVENWNTLYMHLLGVYGPDVQFTAVGKEEKDWRKKHGYLYGNIFARIQVDLPDFAQALDIILCPGYSSPEALLESFDVMQSQIGFLLSGECLVGSEFQPITALSVALMTEAGKRRWNSSPWERKKVARRLEKYKHKINAALHENNQNDEIPF